MNKKYNTCYRFLILSLCILLPCESLLARKRRRRGKRTDTQLAKTTPTMDSFKQDMFPENITIDIPSTVSLAQAEVSPETKLDKIRKTLPPELRKTTPAEVLPETSELELETPEEEKIEFHFQDADLQTLVKQVENLFNITFITDEMIQPILKGGKPLKGNKISFKTHDPLSKKEAWDLFITFLNIAGFSVVPEADPNRFRIKTVETARKSPIPAFIGVDHTTLPDNDELIRYVYFIENSTPDAIKNIVDPLRSPSSGFVLLQEHKAFILTDKAYNIKTLMKIVKELDKVSMPQSMSVLKLRRADAQQVKELYDSLIRSEDTSPTRLFSARKQPTSLYFPENTSIIAEPRTNALILLGPKNAIQKIEDFIIKHIDVELDKPYSPLYVHQLKYADATTVADIMNSVSQIGKETEVGKSGGVRGEDKYLKSISFVPEPETNRIIIKGHYEDYLMAKDIIEKLDEAQPQVAIEILILGVSLKTKKELGAQIRSKEPGPSGLIGKNVEFQTSGLFQSSKIVENKDAQTGARRLLGNLINLVTGAVPGNTIISLGIDNFGVWGIFQALQTVTNTQLISNPFLIATNKTPAEVSVGEVKRVITSTIIGTQDTDALGDDSAKLEVKITPQINSDGMIILDLNIIIDEFRFPDQPQNAEKNVKEIKTTTIVANKEVLALGGLIRNKVDNSLKKTPLLGDIPILGWLFKNKQKTQDKENLLILISTRIIEPQLEREVRRYTKGHIDGYYGTLDDMHDISEKHDPIHKLFFEGKEKESEKKIESFLFERQEKTKKQKNKKRKSLRKTAHKNKKNEPVPVRKQADSASKSQQTTQKSAGRPAQNTLSNRNEQTDPLYNKIKEKRRTKLSLTDFFNNTGSRV